MAKTLSPVILTVSPDDLALDNDGSTSYSDEVTLVGTAVPYSSIVIYDGSTQIGIAAAGSSGIWTFQTKPLTDSSHSFTATATAAGSTTSSASAPVTLTVAADISNFSPLTDQWSSPIYIGGQPYYVENANTNGNAPWAITQLDSHTLQFQVRPNDLWADNASHRSEVSGGTVFAANQTIDLSYQFEVLPGFNDTSNNLAWQILGQFHADDNNAIYQAMSEGSPPLAFHLTGANGQGEGDYLAVQVLYALPGQTSWTAATPGGNPLNGFMWVSSTPIVRGQYYDVQVEASFQNNSSGFVEVWINGTQVVDYHGAVGYGGGVYWKEGVYEGWSSNQTITVNYANTTVSGAPGAPLILTDNVNGNQVMLSGTAQANSTLSFYDGSTKLGTVAVAATGAWFYETGALSTGSHNITATVTDSAGNTSASSSAATTTISTFTGPIIKSVTTSAAAGEALVGQTITFTLAMSSAVTVTGTPTLSLNDGGTAVYKSGSGSSTLTFTYVVGANDTTLKGLAITGMALPGGAAITDASSNAAILTGAAVEFPGVTIDTQAVKTPVFGDPVANSDGTFTFTGTAGANTTVYFMTSYGSPLGSAVVDSTGHWTFTSPSFDYGTWNSIQAYNVNSLGDVSATGTESGSGFGATVKVPASPTITGNALTGNAVTLYGTVSSGVTKVTVYDGTTALGNATVNSDNTWSFTSGALSGGAHKLLATGTSSSGTSGKSAVDTLLIGGASVGVSSIVASGTGITSGSGDLGAGSVVTLTVNMSGNVTVAGGPPTLTLNDGGTATYVGGSGSSTLTFSYTVAAGQNTSDLAVTAFTLNGGALTDASGSAADLSGVVTSPSGTLQIDTTLPTVSSVVASGTGITSGSGDLAAGKVVTLTVNTSEAVTVTGGTPTLTLNDGGIATYTGGSGTSALTFSYTVAAGQDTSDLTLTAINLNGAAVRDGAGNTADLSAAVTNPSGTLQIDTTPPTVSSVVASGSGITAGSGTLGVGSVLSLTVNLSEAVTVSSGTPTLALNNGGTATYTGGSGTNVLTFSYTVAAGQTTSDLAVTAANLNGAVVQDGAGNAANLAGAVVNPSGTLQINANVLAVSSVAASGSGITSGNGDLGAGSVVTLTVNLSDVVTVASGTPTLTLNDGGTATYTGGSGTSALTFSYTVAAGQNTSDLAVTALNLNGATVTDSTGTSTTLTGAVTNPSGTLQIDTTAPTVASVAASGTGVTAGNGDLSAGSVVTLTVNLSEAVTVAGGTPTLTLNDGGTATYVGGSGTSALTFSYSVAAGQNTSDLAVAAVSLNGATVTDGAGNSASLTGAVTNPSGTLQIDTSTPTVSSVAASGTGISSGSGDLGAGSVVTLTVNLSEAVTVAGGTPTLTLNDGGTATYVGGSGTSALTFSYTVATGQNTSDLAVTAVTLNGATVKDGAGNSATLTGAVTNPSGTLQIDGTAPTVSSVATSGAGITSGSGDLGAGSAVTLTVNLSEAVTVTGGTPTLTLNDGATATYSGGSRTSALTFSYTVAAGQSTSDLTVTGVNLNGAAIKDGAGNSAILTGAVTNPSGTLQIDATAPTIASVAASGTGITSGSGDLGAGSVVTLTVNLSEAVTVAGGTPTLTLDDGGTATYTGGSGTSALIFSYMVAAGQNTSDLTVTAVNLNGATVKDGTGNSAALSGAVTSPSGTLQIDTTAPTVASVVASGAGISGGAGSVAAGNVVTLTVNLSEAVTVAGGTPTLTLNDGGTATYTGGSGTNALTFSYAVNSADRDVSALAISQLNLPGGTTIKDGAGNTANLTGTAVTFSGLSVDQPITIEAAGSTDLVQVAHTYYLDPSNGGTGPQLKLGGAALTVGQLGSNWTIVGAEAVSGGYDVAWKNTATGQYNIWSVDSSGNYVKDLASGVSATSFGFESFETVFRQDLNGDGTIGVTSSLIQANGSTALLHIAENYYLYVNGSGPELKYAGSPVTQGQFGAVSVIGAVQTSTGFDVAFQMTGTNNFTFWTTDSAGNYTSNISGWVAGTSFTAESMEAVFGQDFNKDGTVGVTSSLVRTSKSTNFLQIADQYYVYVNGSGPSLKYAGSPVTKGQFGNIDVIAAVQTSSGYDVAFQMTGTNNFTFWTTDSAGNYTSNISGWVAGTSFTAESMEAVFGQDFNKDGTVGVTSSLIQRDGTTDLLKIANNYYLYTNGSGPSLKYGGALVTDGQFANTSFMGAIQTSTGYDVAMKNTSTGLFTVWNVDSNGNYVNSLISNAAPSSSALLSMEVTLQQDLNGDGIITIPNGQTMELTGSFSGEIVFGGAAGTLVIDHSDQFHGTIGGQLTTTDVIDFKDIGAGSNAALAYSGNNSPGTLTVSDGSHTAHAALLGSYSLANFTASSDGHGGTSVIDPPLASAQASSLDQQIALFSQYMASDFSNTSSHTEAGPLLGLDQLSSLAHLAVMPPQQHANV